MNVDYTGLIYIPATDLNFISGIKRLDDTDLAEMLHFLQELEEKGESHKGRIKAVEKEQKTRIVDSIGEEVGSKRGRKKLDGENSREIVAMDKFQADIETAERLYGDGLPYDRDRLEDSAKFFLAQTAQSLFESGKIFHRLKAHEGHGGFMESLARIGIPQSTANYAMAVVVKFGPNSQPAGNLGVEKLRMLTVFEEDDIKEYVNGGPLGSIPHDDVEKMSKRELQTAVREERKKRKEQKKTQEDAIAKKEEKINELEQQLRYQEPPTKEQLAAVALEPLKKKLFEHVLMAQYYLDEAVKVVVAAQKVEGATFPQLQEWAMTHYEQLAPIGELFDELDRALNNCGPHDPNSTGM